MSGYIGVEPVPLATQVVYEKIFTAPFQVVEIPGGYTVGNIEVFINGIFLHPNGYTATNGASVDLGVSFEASTETPFEFYIKEVRQYEDVNAIDSSKLAIDENLSEIAMNGTAAQEAARNNIGQSTTENIANGAVTTDKTSFIHNNLEVGSLVTWRDDDQIITTMTTYMSYDPTAEGNDRSVMVLCEGSIRVTLALGKGNDTDISEAQVLLNGSVIATFTHNDNNSSYITFNKDVTVEYGDIITWRCKKIEGLNAEFTNRRILANDRVPVIKLSF